MALLFAYTLSALPDFLFQQQIVIKYFTPLIYIPSILLHFSFSSFLLFFLFLSHFPSPLSPSRRSYSIDKSPGSSNAASPISQRKDINRSESLRVVSNQTHRIFRPSDLIHGEVLGKGCFGQAIKVRHF